MKIHVYFGMPTEAAGEWLRKRHSFEDTHILDHPFAPGDHPSTRRAKFLRMVDQWRGDALEYVALVTNCPYLVESLEGLPETKGYQTVYVCTPEECVPVPELPGVEHFWDEARQTFFLGAAVFLMGHVNWDSPSGTRALAPLEPQRVCEPADRLVFVKIRDHSSQWEVYAVGKDVSVIPAEWVPASTDHPIARVTAKFFTDAMDVNFYDTEGNELPREERVLTKGEVESLIVAHLFDLEN